LSYVARYIGAHDPIKVGSAAVRGVHGVLSTIIMFFGGIGINTVSIDGIVVDMVSNNLMFDHEGLALSGVLPHASITSCLARLTGSFLTMHDVPYDHGKYAQDVTKAGPPYLCKSTPDDVDAIVVADDEASNLIGNVTLNTVRESGILTHRFLVPDQVDVAKLFVSTSAGSAYRHIHNMINTTAVVVPETTDGSQPKTSSLRALVESTRGHCDCIMPHISARHACVESSTPPDAPSTCPLVTQMLANVPFGTVIRVFSTATTVNLWGEALCDQGYPDAISSIIIIRRCCNEKLYITSDTRVSSMVDMEPGWGAIDNVVFEWGATDNVASRWGAAVNMVVRLGAAVIRVMQRWEALGTEMLSLFTCGVITVNRRYGNDAICNCTPMEKIDVTSPPTIRYHLPEVWTHAADIDIADMIGIRHHQVEVHPMHNIFVYRNCHDISGLLQSHPACMVTAEGFSCTRLTKTPHEECCNGIETIACLNHRLSYDIRNDERNSDASIAEGLLITHSYDDVDKFYRPLDNGEQVADTTKESGEQVQVVGVTEKSRGGPNFAVTYECIRIILSWISPIPTSLTLHDITVDNSAAVMMPIDVEVGNSYRFFFSNNSTDVYEFVTLEDHSQYLTIGYVVDNTFEDATLNFAHTDMICEESYSTDAADSLYMNPSIMEANPIRVEVDAMKSMSRQSRAKRSSISKSLHMTGWTHPVQLSTDVKTALSWGAVYRRYLVYGLDKDILGGNDGPNTWIVDYNFICSSGDDGLVPDTDEVFRSSNDGEQWMYRSSNDGEQWMDMTSSFQVMERPYRKLVKTEKQSTSSSTRLSAMRDPEDAVLKSMMNARVQSLLRFMYACLQIITYVMSVLRVWIVTSCQHYTDDLTIASKNPKAITDALENVYKFKLKGTAPLNSLLGCDYYRDSHGILCQQPKKFIEKMEDTYVNLFGEKPKHASSPLVKGDHPECDTSELLEEREIKIYQSMIESAQWTIQLGRFDIAVQVMTLSSFRPAPRRGHLDRIKRLYGYVAKMKEAAIRYRTEMPDVSDLKFVEEDWSRSPYAGSKEDIPKDMPRALGKPVLLLTYGDANLCHDLLSGKAVTGLLHFINKTPFDWYSKKQNTVETATYGAESVAGRTAIEQMRANKLTLHYLGVPIEGASILVGDNKTAVDAATLPHSKLRKHYLMLSFHFLKSAMASGAFKYVWADGKDNASDILTKHWGYQQVWPLLRPILFWGGDTLDIVRQSRRKLKTISNRVRRR